MLAEWGREFLLAVLVMSAAQKALAQDNECAELDIVFVVDESGSICDNDPSFNLVTSSCRNWDSVRNFLGTIIERLPIGVRDTHVGLITYRQEAVVDWTLDRYYDKVALLDAVRTLPYEASGTTYTADALEAMRTQVFTKGGDRSRITNVAILITDGIASPSQRPLVDGVARAAKQDDIIMFSVGVTREINETLLQVVSTGGVRDRDYFTSPDFDRLSEVIDSLLNFACAVTPAPPVVVAGCTQLDLVFVVDESGSICDADPTFDRENKICRNWESVRSFLYEVVNSLPISERDVHVGLISYREEVVIDWRLNRYYDKAQLLDAIVRLPYEPFGLTYTADALDVMRRQVFGQEGDRRDVINVGFLLTDGKASVPQRPLVDEMAQKVKDSNIIMFSIGVTPEVNTTLLQVVSTGGRANLDYYTSPDFQQLEGVIQALVTQACSATPAPATPTPDRQCRELDITFVVDESGSICDDDPTFVRAGNNSNCNNWRSVRRFLAQVINNLPISERDVHVAMITYREEVIVDWTLSRYYDKNALLDAVNTLQYDPFGFTYTADALQAMRTEVFTKSGDRPGVRNVGILITDGKPSPSQLPIVDGIARDAKQQDGIVMFSVGVTAEINETLLQTVSTGGVRGRDYFTSPDFSRLEDVISDLLDAACLVVPTPAPPTPARTTTPQPTPAPTRPPTPAPGVCNPVDVVIALDSSGSIGADNFQRMIQFSTDLVNELPVGSNARVGMQTYGTTSKVEFNLNRFQTKGDAVNSIVATGYTGGTTNTADAIRRMKDEMFSGNLDSSFPNVGVIVTDGQSNNRTLTWEMAIDARAKGIHLIVVGIGDWVRFDELRAIASYPADKNVYLVKDFPSLNDIADRIYDSICNRINECYSNPCRNGGSCVDVIGGYYCQCTSFFTGMNCERVCRGEADVVFIMDTSGSIQHERFSVVQEFLVNVTSHLEIWGGKVRVGLVSFYDNARVEFYLDQYSRVDDIQEAIRFVEFNGGRTNIASGLQMARENVFDTNRGDRPDVPNYVIIFTDGAANIREGETMNEAAMLKNAGVHVVVVSVGRDLHYTALRGIASWPWQANVREIDYFVSIETLVEPTVASLCNDVNECGFNFCLNGGTCVDGLGEYICVCPVGRLGQNCELQCSASYDITFMVDVGSSFSSLHDVIIPWMREVVYGMEYRFDTVRTALISYNKNAYLHFGLNAYSTREEVLVGVSSFTNIGGKSHTKMALDMTRDQIFTSRNGDRGNVQNIIVLLSDGCSTIEHALTQPAAQSLKDQGVLFYVVAIGELVDMQEMTALATNNALPYLLRIISTAQITGTVNTFLQSVCV